MPRGNPDVCGFVNEHGTHTVGRAYRICPLTSRLDDDSTPASRVCTSPSLELKRHLPSISYLPPAPPTRAQSFMAIDLWSLRRVHPMDVLGPGRRGTAVLACSCKALRYRPSSHCASTSNHPGRERTLRLWFDQPSQIQHSEQSMF